MLNSPLVHLFCRTDSSCVSDTSEAVNDVPGMHWRVCSLRLVELGLGILVKTVIRPRKNTHSNKYLPELALVSHYLD